MSFDLNQENIKIIYNNKDVSNGYIYSKMYIDYDNYHFERPIIIHTMDNLIIVYDESWPATLNNFDRVCYIEKNHIEFSYVIRAYEKAIQWCEKYFENHGRTIVTEEDFKDFITENNIHLICGAEATYNGTEFILSFEFSSDFELNIYKNALKIALNYLIELPDDIAMKMWFKTDGGVLKL